MNTTTPSFDILAVVPEDIPRLAHIHVIACMADAAFSLYFDSAEEFTERIVNVLGEQIGDPSWHHAKAVDKATGMIAGWASWKIPSDQEIRERDARLQSEVSERTPTVKNATENNNNDNSTQIQSSEQDVSSFSARLRQHVRQDTEKWVYEWTRSRRHIILKALYTDPAFQRRGMGLALVDFGNKIADRAALPVLLQASADGWPLYTRQGFKVVHYLDLDLGQWTRRAGDGDGGCVDYRLRYMIRLPVTLDV